MHLQTYKRAHPSGANKERGEGGLAQRQQLEYDYSSTPIYQNMGWRPRYDMPFRQICSPPGSDGSDSFSLSVSQGTPMVEAGGTHFPLGATFPSKHAGHAGRNHPTYTMAFNPAVKLTAPA